MASSFGSKFKVTLGGCPSQREITVKIEGVPEGTVIDYGQISDLIRRWDDRTGRYGEDEREEYEREIIWKTGVISFGGELGIVTGSTVEAVVDSPAPDMDEWEEYKLIPRPGHADFAAVMKDGPKADFIGGGRFSEDLTLGLCVAGAVAKQILAGRGVEVLSDIAEISGSKNPLTFDDIIESTVVEEDSVGGVVECAVMGLEAGSCGDSYFDGLRPKLAQAVFGIPGVCGVEFGSGFAGTSLSGSENNDPYVIDEDGNVRTSSNNHGGILGGVATGMPIVLRAAVSPAPSIGKEQVSVNLDTMKPEYITIKGKKTACNVSQTAACVEASAAAAVLDALLLEEKETVAEEGSSEDIDHMAGHEEGKTGARPFGLLGRKLGYSFSPDIHRQIGEAAGRTYDYVLFEKEPEELEAFIKGGEWEGLNVTVPYKEDVIPFLDKLSEEAAAIGAVNTIVRKDGRLIGYNTDYYGFMHTLDANEVQVEDAKCLVLGAGGASKAVCAVLKDMGAGQVVVMSRKGETTFADIADHKDADILINTTPVGMYPDTGKSLVYPGTFTKLKWVVDLIYNPIRTNLLCQAKKSLMEPISGLQMLVSQAVYSYMLFTDNVIEERDEITEKIADAMRSEKQNILLIGMPGTGKTTVGTALADMLGRELFDTDEMIIARDGRPIPEIFADEGEEYFRDLESAAASELSQKTGVIISGGGGIITREENYYALAENSFIVFLNRDLTLLPIEGRPLSQSQPLERLYQARLPLYRSWCDAEVDMNGLTPEETAEKIMEVFR
ncbi:MAG: chorismate synthase [Anaerovoracaceae bacterium]